MENHFPTAQQVHPIHPTLNGGGRAHFRQVIFVCMRRANTCKEGRKETETKKREDEGRDQNSITALVFRRARGEY